MKILHIITYQKGGAAMAAIRLHKSLIANDYDSKILFLECIETDTYFKYMKINYFVKIFLKIVMKFQIPLSIEEYKILKHKRKFEIFTFAKTQYKKLHEHPLVSNADIINLHWIGNFVDYKTFFENIEKPIVWTLHDMGPLQGGFHYKEDEIRNANTLKKFDEKQYRIKKLALSSKKQNLITIVAPSNWLLSLSKESELLGRFQHKHIPYGINTTVFKLQDKMKCKQKLNLSPEKVAVLFVSEKLNNYRKGFDMVLELLKDHSIISKCTFIAVGETKRVHQIAGINYLGTISKEEEMSLIYNAADIFILPSREDNLPNTMIESLCCGTPVVGFEIGGLKESIKNFENGMLANKISVLSLKEALLTCVKLNNTFNRVQISSAAHQMYASEFQFHEYISVYKKCLYVDSI